MKLKLLTPKLLLIGLFNVSATYGMYSGYGNRPMDHGAQTVRQPAPRVVKDPRTQTTVVRTDTQTSQTTQQSRSTQSGNR